MWCLSDIVIFNGHVQPTTRFRNKNERHKLQHRVAKVPAAERQRSGALGGRAARRSARNKSKLREAAAINTFRHRSATPGSRLKPLSLPSTRDATPEDFCGQMNTFDDIGDGALFLHDQPQAFSRLLPQQMSTRFTPANVAMNHPLPCNADIAHQYAQVPFPGPIQKTMPVQYPSNGAVQYVYSTPYHGLTQHQFATQQYMRGIQQQPPFGYAKHIGRPTGAAPQNFTASNGQPSRSFHDLTGPAQSMPSSHLSGPSLQTHGLPVKINDDFLGANIFELFPQENNQQCESGNNSAANMPAASANNLGPWAIPYLNNGMVAVPQHATFTEAVEPSMLNSPQSVNGVDYHIIPNDNGTSTFNSPYNTNCDNTDDSDLFPFGNMDAL